MGGDHLLQQSYQTELHTLAPQTRDVLIEGAPLMDQWSKTECKPKDVGGMEEWAKTHKGDLQVDSCDWYHGTWQYLRLLDMVATPPWYTFYNDKLSALLRAKPDANVLISAAADFGMAATLIDAIKTAGTKPTITLYDICNTPLLATSGTRSAKASRSDRSRQHHHQHGDAAAQLRPHRHRRVPDRAQGGVQALDRRALERSLKPGGWS